MLYVEQGNVMMMNWPYSNYYYASTQILVNTIDLQCVFQTAPSPSIINIDKKIEITYQHFVASVGTRHTALVLGQLYYNYTTTSIWSTRVVGSGST